MEHMRYLPFLFFLVCLFAPWSASAQSGQRTEEYAVISAWQQGQRTFISVQIGSESTPDREFEPEKGGKRFDMSPVIREMETLNAMGFELVSGNSGVIAGPSPLLPFYTFIFKRRIQ